MGPNTVPPEVRQLTLFARLTFVPCSFHAMNMVPTRDSTFHGISMAYPCSAQWKHGTSTWTGSTKHGPKHENVMVQHGYGTMPFPCYFHAIPTIAAWTWLQVPGSTWYRASSMLFLSKQHGNGLVARRRPLGPRAAPRGSPWLLHCSPCYPLLPRGALCFSWYPQLSLGTPFLQVLLIPIKISYHIIIEVTTWL